MIRLEGRGATYGELWFEEELPRDPGVDIARYRCRQAPIRDVCCTPFLSLVSDLTVDAAAVESAFDKSCRYKVRRADTKDGLEAEFIAEPAGRLEEFRAFFDSFARQKAHEPCDPQWLRAACEAGQLVLTRVSRQGETLVWHAYGIAGKTTWLHYTGSLFRGREADYRALVSRANCWLHWKDMLRLRELGIERYDWGGLFQEESVPGRAGVNDFKRFFGGRESRTFDCTVPLTLRGRIYLPLRDAWHHRRAAFQGRRASAVAG